MQCRLLEDNAVVRRVALLLASICAPREEQKPKQLKADAGQ